ncbi:DUF2207 domain-containing protein [Blastococcus xanthinilyticus]|uniref:Putative membrane protein DUF2207 n=1 Tax=Blastococcus xanthinilyticus TaxID=1564164 RepID=A0A5S5CX35_9ACTN|nr:DUF2207 domain-containing protein [Blastococcus xanthinilyticus]TYP86919.1 putative membrane protein DUF2207 [Blastococcus xanthinilyticus]
METPRRTDRVRRRRRIDGIALLVVAVLVGVLTGLIALAGGGERVRQLWVAATVADDGSARITEVIDYDFGGEDRRGVLRRVPGLDASASVEASSPDAPADITVADEEIRIGDPDRTVTGLHRYVLTYTLADVVSGDELAWDAVGPGWEVPIDEVVVQVSAPARLTDGRCATGEADSTEPCDVEGAAPGRLAARVDSLEPGEGVTVGAATGAPLDGAPPLPGPPALAPVPEGTSALLTGALAGAAALLAAALAWVWIRRAGRERVPTVGIPVRSAPGEQARIDLAELADSATPSPTLPAALSPAQGGVLLAGSVTAAHKAAWLIDQAVAGAVDLEPSEEDREKVTLVRRQPGEGAARRLLDMMFRERERLPLDSYDEDFGKAWAALGEELGSWQQDSGLWDPAADRRTTWIRIVGGLAGVVGFGLALLAGYLAIAQVGVPLVVAAGAGALTGAGAAAALAGWELRVLTPDGAAAWVQVESLRRFLAGSPQPAVDEAVGSGSLGRYTAWAVALGEAERWTQLASRVPAASSGGRHLTYAAYAPALVASCGAASTAPSSSTGGTTSVGAGAGGGGGGSW